MRRLATIFVFGSLMLCGNGLCLGGDDPARAAPATSDEIASLIRDLGDASYQERQTATRRLCEIGMLARAGLEAASRGDDVEIAIRAKGLLRTLDSLWFAGVEVAMSFSQPATVWDQPVDLLVTIANTSEYPSRIPFLGAEDANNLVGSDAGQVGTMLDLADFIRVRSPNGRELELRVDDIQDDPAVAKSVKDRLEEGSSSVLAPGGKLVIRASVFNRGWARYPMLDKGTYTVLLIYEPAWDDEELRTRHVGRVMSNEARLRVTSSAPLTVSRAGVEASLSVERRGPFVIAELTNRTDQTMLINKNFGAATPFAVGRWVYTFDEEITEVSAAVDKWSGWDDFDATLLVEALPGRSVEIARMETSELRKTLADAGAELDVDGWTVHFSYASFCDRSWQRRQGSTLLGNDSAPEIFRTLLPRRILAARHASNRLRLSGQ